MSENSYLWNTRPKERTLGLVSHVSIRIHEPLAAYCSKDLIIYICCLLKKPNDSDPCSYCNPEAVG